VRTSRITSADVKPRFSWPNNTEKDKVLFQPTGTIDETESTVRTNSEKRYLSQEHEKYPGFKPFIEDGQFGVKNDAGNIIIKVQYDSIVPYRSPIHKRQYFLCLKDNKWGAYDHFGKKILGHLNHHTSASIARQILVELYEYNSGDQDRTD
jgi:hypothetical protein